MAAINELYMLVAYLAIGLMSITVPTYAIAVTYLARETSESRKDLRRRRKELADKLEELKKRLEDDAGVASIAEEIRKCEKEDEHLKNRQLCLSMKGAVALPFVSFLLALLIAAYGYYSGGDVVILMFLLISLSMGVILLMKSLLAIEQAALRPEEVLLPDLKVTFDSGADTMSFKVSEEKSVGLLVTNLGKEIAEEVHVIYLFGPQFGIRQIVGANYQAITQGPTSPYPNHKAVAFKIGAVPVIFAVMTEVHLVMPDKSGTYDVQVEIRARRVGLLKSQLHFVILQ